MTKETHNVSGDRYECDWTLLKQGFFQIDTDQDASYYGNWINPERKIKVSFIEGDLIIIKYDNDQEMIQDLKECDEYESEVSERNRGIKIDIGLKDRDRIHQMFQNLGLEQYVH
jgi:hypothetical protein